MNWLDAVLIILLVGGVLLGLKNGILVGFLPFAGLVIGLYLAIRFSGPLGRWMSFLPQPSAARWIAFALVLILTLLLAVGLARLLYMLLTSAMLGWLDHALGALWGLIIGAVIIAAVLSLWMQVFGQTEPMRASPVARFLLARFDTVLSMLPVEFQAVRNFFEGGLKTITG